MMTQENEVKKEGLEGYQDFKREVLIWLEEIQNIAKSFESKKSGNKEGCQLSLKIEDSKKSGNEEGYPLSSKIEDSKKELLNDMFRIGILGMMKSGKSTFVNALLGKDLLSTSIKTDTAALSHIMNVSKWNNVQNPGIHISEQLKKSGFAIVEFMNKAEFYVMKYLVNKLRDEEIGEMKKDMGMYDKYRRMIHSPFIIEIKSEFDEERKSREIREKFKSIEEYVKKIEENPNIKKLIGSSRICIELSEMKKYTSAAYKGEKLCDFVSRVDIYLNNIQLLENDIILIDTAGYGDMVATRELKSSEAIQSSINMGLVLVRAFHGIYTMENKKIIQQCLKSCGTDSLNKMFFFLNDDVGPEKIEEEDLLDALKKLVEEVVKELEEDEIKLLEKTTLEKAIKAEAIEKKKKYFKQISESISDHVIAVNSLEAFHAKEKNDKQLMEDSGMKKVEKKIEGFLLGDDLKNTKHKILQNMIKNALDKTNEEFKSYEDNSKLNQEEIRKKIEAINRVIKEVESRSKEKLEVFSNSLKVFGNDFKIGHDFSKEKKDALRGDIDIIIKDKKAYTWATPNNIDNFWSTYIIGTFNEKKELIEKSFEVNLKNKLKSSLIVLNRDLSDIISKIEEKCTSVPLSFGNTARYNPYNFEVTGKVIDILDSFDDKIVEENIESEIIKGIARFGEFTIFAVTSVATLSIDAIAKGIDVLGKTIKGKALLYEMANEGIDVFYSDIKSQIDKSIEDITNSYKQSVSEKITEKVKRERNNLVSLENDMKNGGIRRADILKHIEGWKVSLNVIESKIGF